MLLEPINLEAMGLLMRWVQKLERWLTEWQRRTDPRCRSPQEPAKRPSETRLAIYAILLVVGPPFVAVGLGLLTSYVPLKPTGFALLYAFESCVFGSLGLILTMTRYAELGLPSPNKHHPWIPLILNSAASALLALMALMYAFSGHLWAVVGIVGIWLILLCVSIVGKLVLDRARAANAHDAASSAKSHG